jgi:hypothetical protein
MLIKKKSNDYLVLLVAASSFGTALFFHTKKSPSLIQVSKQETASNINREFLKIFSIGNKKLISNALWIQTLLESDEEKLSDKYTHSWMYHRFKTISALDPKFYENYLWGGMYLSIIKDDLEGAAEIYDLGLNYYPDDYNLNYNSGFNLYFEMDNYQAGLPRLEKIQNHPKAPWRIKFLVNKLRFETNKNFEQALSFLEFQLETTEDNFLKEKIKKDIYSLKVEKDLKCLNSQSDDCNKKDPIGRKYIFQNGKWNSKNKVPEFKLFRSNEFK